MTQPRSDCLHVETDTERSAGALLNGAGDRAQDQLRPRLCVPALEPDETSDNNWNLMFDAVKLRLQRCVDEWSSSTTNGANDVRPAVLDCVDALSQLQSVLNRERAGHHRLAQDFVDTQTELHEARAELIDTQAGERQARHLALHDGLTSLPNRRYFLERLEHALAHLQPDAATLALLYLDLDGFKSVNDQHGHDAGDKLLNIVATRLNRVVRSEDMVSRIGGDEFACLRAGAAPYPQLIQLAEKIFDAVSAPMKIGDALTLSIRPSIGIAIYPKDGLTAAELLMSADAAMYRAKRRRGHHVFFGEMRNSA